MKLSHLLYFTAVPLTQADTLWDTISTSQNNKIFTSVVEKAGLDKILSGSNDYTVFVPSDTAFSAWPDYQLKYVLNTPSSALQFAQYSIHEGSLVTSKMSAPMNITTLHPYHYLYASQADANQVHLYDATCGVGKSTKANMQVDNGIIHMVDTVFQPPAAICPDKILIAEQRTQARITSYGYECRSKNETRHIYISDNLKPVGLTVDDEEEMVFWANDQDYPHGSPTSWISKIFYNETNYSILSENVIDPQGLFADPSSKTLYFASHSGYAVAKIDYNGSQLETIYAQKGNANFQPSDVVVDTDQGIIFVSVEGTDTVSGSLWKVNTDGTNATKLLPNKNRTAGLIQNYGICLDQTRQQVFWVQGGNGGSLHCFAYGDDACEKEIIVDNLQYPYMCDIDNSYAKYGGPTRIAWTEANRPGTIYYANTDGSEASHIVSSDLDAPMGITFACSPY